MRQLWPDGRRNNNDIEEDSEYEHLYLLWKLNSHKSNKGWAESVSRVGNNQGLTRRKGIKYIHTNIQINIF